MTKKIFSLAATFALLVSCLFTADITAWAQDMQGSVNIYENDVINEDIIGLGVNLSFSDYEYIDFSVEPGLEWGTLHSQHIPYPKDEEGWDDFFKLIDFLNPQFVRLQLGMTQWEPVNDNDNPQNMNLDSGFIFSPNFRTQHPKQHLVKENADIYMQSLYKILDHFEERSTFVFLANWNLASANFSSEGLWISAAGDNNQFGYPYDIEEFTESLAALVYHLKADREYACVQGISIWNEPENYKNGNFFSGYTGDETYYEMLAKIYKSLDAQLKKCGVRDGIGIFAIDGSVEYNNFGDGGNQQTTKLLELCGDVIDYISLHTYETSLNYETELRTQGTIEGGLINRLVKHVFNQLDSYAEKTGTEPKKFVSGEFGSFEYVEGDGGERLFVQRLHSVEAFMAMMNNRMKAAATWDLNANTHTVWRLLTFARETIVQGATEAESNQNWVEYKRFVPEPIYYYPLALAGKYIKQGSDVVRTEISGFEDENGVQRVASLAVKNGADKTLLLVNDSFSEADIKLSGFTGSFYRGTVNENAYYKIINEGSARLEEGTRIKLAPRSITVFTTYEEIIEKPDSKYTEKVIKYSEATATLKSLGLIPQNINPEEKLNKLRMADLFVSTQKIPFYNTAVNKTSMLSDIGMAEEKLVEYMINSGYMTANNSTSFGRDDPVTTADLLKLYMKSLGYNEDEGMVSRAIKLGVLDGSYDPAEINSPATIDILCGIAYNSLLAVNSKGSLQIDSFIEAGKLSIGAVNELQNNQIDYARRIFKGNKQADISPEAEQANVSFIDECDSQGLAKTVDSSGSLGMWSDAPEFYWGDTTTFVPGANVLTDQWITYAIPAGANTLTLTAYSGSDLVNWRFYCSEDGLNFTELSSEADIEGKTNLAFKYTYNLNNFPVGSKYVKIVYPLTTGTSGALPHWDPRVGRVEIYSAAVLSEGGGIFPDIYGAECERSVNTLYALGIVMGDNFGNFNPQNPITRGEFACLAARLLGIEQSGGAEHFSDVPEEHFAYSAISLLTEAGLVNGFEGNFYPNDNISSAEAVKIAVNLLGYGVKAELRGGYPGGYMAMASEIGLKTDPNASEKITRESAAELIYSTLSKNMLEQTTFGDRYEYDILKGNTILNKYRKISEARGIITNNKNTLLEGTTPISDGMVEINGARYFTGKTNAESLLGYNIKFYYSYDDDNNNTLLYVEPYNTSTTALNGDDIQRLAGNRLYYSDEGDKERSINLDDNAKIIFNKGYLGKLSSGAYNGMFAGLTGDTSLEFIDNNDDGRYDIVIFTEFETYVVEYYNQNEMIIFDKTGKSLDVSDINNIEISQYTLTKNGEKISVDDIKEWDVLTILKGDDFVEIHNTRRPVAGPISEIYTNKSKTYAIIDEKSYLVSENIKDKLQFSINTYYQDINGRLCAQKNTTEILGEYGYAVGIMADKTDLGDYLMKIFTKNGEMKIFKLPAKYHTADFGFYDGSGEFAPQIIKFSSNSEDKITEITTKMWNSGSGTEKITESFVSSQAQYLGGNLNYFTSGFYSTTRDTVIFRVPAPNLPSEDYDYNILQGFNNKESYNIKIYDADPFNVSGAVVVQSSGDTYLPWDLPIFVYEKTTLATDGDKIVKKLYGYENGVYRGYILDDNVAINRSNWWQTDSVTANIFNTKQLDDLKTGDIIHIKLNEREQITVVHLVLMQEQPQHISAQSSIYTAMGVVADKNAGITKITAGTEIMTLNLKPIFIYLADVNNKKIKVITQNDIKIGSKIGIQFYEESLRGAVIYE